MSTTNTSETNSQINTVPFPHTPEAHQESVLVEIFANPYNLSATGFQFSTYEQYEQLSKNLKDAYGCPVEEFEFVLISAFDSEDAELFECVKVAQHNLQWFMDEGIYLSTDEKIALCFLISEYGYNLEEAIEKMEEVSFQEGDIQSVAEELFDEIYEVPKAIAAYIDYEKFARDCELNGDLRSYTFDGKKIVITNGNSL